MDQSEPWCTHGSTTRFREYHGRTEGCWQYGGCLVCAEVAGEHSHHLASQVYGSARNFRDRQRAYELERIKREAEERARASELERFERGEGGDASLWHKVYRQPGAGPAGAAPLAEVLASREEEDRELPLPPQRANPHAAASGARPAAPARRSAGSSYPAQTTAAGSSDDPMAPPASGAQAYPPAPQYYPAPGQAEDHTYYGPGTAGPLAEQPAPTQPEQQPAPAFRPLPDGGPPRPRPSRAPRGGDSFARANADAVFGASPWPPVTPPAPPPLQPPDAPRSAPLQRRAAVGRVRMRLPLPLRFRGARPRGVPLRRGVRGGGAAAGGAYRLHEGRYGAHPAAVTARSLQADLDAAACARAASRIVVPAHACSKRWAPLRAGTRADWAPLQCGCCLGAPRRVEYVVSR
eukprot:tig00021682_g23096.t1